MIEMTTAETHDFVGVGEDDCVPSHRSSRNVPQEVIERRLSMLREFLNGNLFYEVCERGTLFLQRTEDGPEEEFAIARTDYLSLAAGIVLRGYEQDEFVGTWSDGTVGQITIFYDGDECEWAYEWPGPDGGAEVYRDVQEWREKNDSTGIASP